MSDAVLVPLVTPLDPAGAVVEDDVRRLIESVGPHARGLMPALATGEGWALSEAQWEDAVGSACRHAGGLPVYAGAVAPTTSAVVARARRARDLGAAAVCATTPFVRAPTAEQVVDHYRTVHAEGGLPVVLYNERSLSGNVTGLTALVACCGLAGVVAVKESSRDPLVARELVAAGVDAAVHQGWEDLIGVTPGLAGCAVALANLEPRLCGELARAPAESALRRRVGEACARHGLFSADWFRQVKAELVRRGVIGSPATAACPGPDPTTQEAT